MKGMAGEINAEQKKQLGMVQDSARHLLALINDVIDISKIEADQIEAGITTFNLAEVLRDIANTFNAQAQEQGVVLNIQIPASIIVTSDERRIKQIIMNLVSNAIKFTNEGMVDVAAGQKGTIVEVNVRDTGIGMAKEDMENLFRPFSRITVREGLRRERGSGCTFRKNLPGSLAGILRWRANCIKEVYLRFLSQ